jgi:hypothetical protein
LSSVSYEITDKEVVDSYWYMMKHSKEYRVSILKFSVLFLASPIAIEFLIRHSITPISISLGAFFFLCYPFFLVHVARSIAKKGAKLISVSPTGMDVSIATQSKSIDWKHVAGISESDKYLFILSNGGNFMCIPKRAFENMTSLNEFKQVIIGNA